MVDNFEFSYAEMEASIYQGRSKDIEKCIIQKIKAERLANSRVMSCRKADVKCVVNGEWKFTTNNLNS
jgi:hypothetical protein